MFRNSFSYSILFPKIKTVSQKCESISTYKDDIIFAEDQLEKLDKDLFIKKFRKLKPWQKACKNNIYSPSGKSNHTILKELNLKKNSNNKKNICLTPKNGIDPFFLGTSNISEISHINNSLFLSKRLKSNSEVNQKLKIPRLNIKSYIDNTKEIFKDNFLSRIINSERNEMNREIIEYKNSLKKEELNLSQDIQLFENFKKNKKSQINKDEEFLAKLTKYNKMLNDELKRTSQEYGKIKDEIIKEIEIILQLKEYAIFIHNLLKINLNVKYKEVKENIGYRRLTDNQLNNLLTDIFSEFNELITKKEFIDLLIKLLEEDNAISIFKMLQENILRINFKLNIIKKENDMSGNENKNSNDYLINTIINKKKEFTNLLKEYEKEKIKIVEINYRINDETIYKRNFLIELFECIKNFQIKNKEDLDIKTFNKTIINSLFIEIKQKENKINEYINEIEIYEEENKELLIKIINKIKQSNRIKKYIEERKIKETQDETKKFKIIEKISQKIVRGRNKYNSNIPLHFYKNKKESIHIDKKKIIENNLIYY